MWYSTLSSRYFAVWLFRSVSRLSFSAQGILFLEQSKEGESIPKGIYYIVLHGINVVFGITSSSRYWKTWKWPTHQSKKGTSTGGKHCFLLQLGTSKGNGWAIAPLVCMLKEVLVYSCLLVTKELICMESKISWLLPDFLQVSIILLTFPDCPY